MTDSLLLYTREHCHLCDQAARLLERMGVAYTPVDIEMDPELEALYGLKVPVLAQPANGRGIEFPFGEKEVRELLDQ